jgi:hypothetical protein
MSQQLREFALLTKRVELHMRQANEYFERALEVTGDGQLALVKLANRELELALLLFTESQPN